MKNLEWCTNCSKGVKELMKEWGKERRGNDKAIVKAIKLLKERVPKELLK